MATAFLVPMPRAVFYDASGNPLSGGFVHTYVPGGTVPKTTWQDAGEVTPNSNPIVLDADGSALIYGSGIYQITVTDALGNAIPAYSGLASNDGGDAISVPGVFDNTAMHDVFSIGINGATTAAEFQWSHPGNYSVEGMGVAMAVPATGAIYTANAFGAYIANGSTVAAGATAGYFYARNTVPGALAFGLNVLVTDQTNVGGAGVASIVVGAETDVGAFDLGTRAIGHNMIGVFPNGTPVEAVAYQVSAPDSPWQVGWLSGDGSAVTGIHLGALGLTSNSNSQTIDLTARDNTNIAHLVAIQAQATTGGANLVFATPNGGVVMTGQCLIGGAATLNSGALVTASGSGLMAFLVGGTGVGSITTDGATTAYNTSSDRRLKRAAGRLRGAGAIIDALKVRMFRWLSGPDKEPEPGFFAQEVHDVYPWAVTKGRGKPGGKKFQPWGIDYSRLVPLLVAESQDLRRRVAQLEARR